MSHHKRKIGSIRTLFRIFFSHKKHGLEFKEACTPEEIEDSFRLRYKVYVEEFGYINKGLDLRKQMERDKYDSYCHHLIAKTKKGSVVGSVRLIRNNSESGFQIEEYSKLPDFIDKVRSMEISRFCVDRLYRGGSQYVTLGIAREIFRYSTRNDIRYWLGVLNMASWKVFLRFGLNFTLIDEVKNWRHGSNAINVVPVYLDVNEALKYLPFINFPFYSFASGDHKFYRYRTASRSIREEIRDTIQKTKNEIKYIEDLNSTF